MAPPPTRPAGGRWRGRLPFMAVARQLRPFSPGAGRTTTAIVLITSIGGLAEAAALVLLGRAALAITSDRSTVDVGVALAPRAALLLALVALALKLTANVAAAHLSSRLSARTVRCGRQALLSSFFRADWATQSEERLGELQDYLTSTVGRLNGVNQAFVSGLNALVSFTILVLAAVAVNPLAAVGCTVAALLLLLILRPLTARTRRYSAAQSAATRALAGDVTQVVRVSQEIRVFGVRRAVLDALGASELRASTPLQRANFTSTVAPGIYQTVALGFLVLAVLAVDLVSDAETGSLGAAVLLLMRGLAYGQNLQSAVQNLANNLPFLSDLHERKQTYDARAERPGSVPLPRLERLELRDVDFEYERGRIALQGISFAVGRHESIGVVGPSGSGKSTLLQLLLRLRPPTRGTLRCGAHDLWDVRAEDWAGRVAFVGQEPRLLDATVAENIAFFRDVPASRIEQAARLAHIHDDVLGWPSGYDTRIGDAGNRISGGQRQRIAIARALVGDPDLIVLDEPTSALDLMSEARLQETLAALKDEVALVIVAHRLSTVQHCDRVLVLRAGRQEAFDTRAALLVSSPYYRDAIELSMLSPSAER